MKLSLLLGLFFGLLLVAKTNPQHWKLSLNVAIVLVCISICSKTVLENATVCTLFGGRGTGTTVG